MPLLRHLAQRHSQMQAVGAVGLGERTRNLAVPLPGALHESASEGCGSSFWAGVLSHGVYRGFFFRTTQCALTQYIQKTASVEGATLLRQPVSTRWCSQVRMLESVVDNRACIETTLLQLRRERFDQNSDAFCALVWVWEPGPWVEAKVLRPVADFLDRVQGEAVEHFMALRAKLLDWIGNLQQSNAAKVKAALEDTVSYIYQPYCLLCREPMPSSHEP